MLESHQYYAEETKEMSAIRKDADHKDKKGDSGSDAETGKDQL